METTLRGKAFWNRQDEIEKKYEPFHGIYGQWLRVTKQITNELGLPNFQERIKLPVYQKAEGLKQGLALLRFHRTYEKAVQGLQHQIAEPSIPPLYREGVQLILNDLLADEVTPIQLNNLLPEAC